MRLGAVRICQAALLMAAIGLALNALAMVAATVIAVIFIGAAQGPINPPRRMCWRSACRANGSAWCFR